MRKKVKYRIWREFHRFHVCLWRLYLTFVGIYDVPSQTQLGRAWVCNIDAYLSRWKGR